jgi:hypothetical protein
VITLALGLGYLSLLILSKQSNEKLISAVMYHETSATVIRKEVVKFDQTNHSYVNDRGDEVKAQPGDQQYRVYYYFDDFNGYDDPFRSQLMEAEKKRILEGQPRFTWTNYNDRTLYDTVNVGDKLTVSYKAYSDGAIDILHAQKSEPRR